MYQSTFPDRKKLAGLKRSINYFSNGILRSIDYFSILTSAYWSILLKREADVIPSELRTSITMRLHSAHLGYDSMLRRARGNVFWPGISSDIKTVS